MNTLSFEQFIIVISANSRRAASKPSLNDPRLAKKMVLPRQVKECLGGILKDFSHGVEARTPYLDQAAHLAERTFADTPSRAKHFSAGRGPADLFLAFYYWLHVEHPDHQRLEDVDKLVLNKRTFEEVAGRTVVIPSRMHPSHIVEALSSPQATTGTVAPSPNIAEFFSERRLDNDLHYSKHVVNVLGRDNEQDFLHAFLDDKGSKFQWLQLAGAGGQGKSRLAFELITEAKENEWDAGFLTEKGLSAFKEHWSNWQPVRPTLIVIDYILGRESLVGPAFRTLVERQGEFKAIVRLLLVERQRWDRGGLERRRVGARNDQPSVKFHPSEYGQAEWFLKLCKEDLPHDDVRVAETRCRGDGHFKNGVIELGKLSSVDLVSLVIKVAEHQGKEIPPAEHDEIKKTLDRIDKSGRPLFAYLLAHRFAEGPFHYGWTREDLLTITIQREQEKRWQAIYRTKDRSPPSLDDNDPSIWIARIATMIDGVDNAIVAETIEEWPGIPRNTMEDALILVDAPRGTGAPLPGFIPPLQPDLLGEWFVLWAFAGGANNSDQAVRVAWALKPEKMAAFLERCTQDFPHRFETARLLDITPPDDAAGRAYRAVSASLLGNLVVSEVDDVPTELWNQVDIAVEEWLQNMSQKRHLQED